MNAFALLSLLSSAIAIIVGGVVFSKSPRSRLNLVYLLLSIAVAYYSFAEFGWRQAGTLEESRMWIRIGAFWPFMFVFIYYTMAEFSGPSWFKSRIVQALVYAPALAIVAMELTTDWVTAESMLEYWGWTNDANTAHAGGIFSSVWFVGGDHCCRVLADSRIPDRSR